MQKSLKALIVGLRALKQLVLADAQVPEVEVVDEAILAVSNLAMNAMMSIAERLYLLSQLPEEERSKFSKEIQTVTAQGIGMYHQIKDAQAEMPESMQKELEECLGFFNRSIVEPVQKRDEAIRNALKKDGENEVN